MDKNKILVFAGFCLIAAISSRRFIASISEKILREMKQEVKDAKDKVKKVEERFSVDARALSALEKALVANPTEGQPSISPQELKKRIAEASVNVKITAFVRARAFRRRHETFNEETKQLLISIFEGLIKADEKNEFHGNHAELAFILKREPNPEYQEAIDALSEAIRIREARGHRGYLAYEFNRAVGTIAKDPTSKESVGSIMADLNKANAHSFWKRVIAGEQNEKEPRNEKLLSWIDKNGATFKN